VIWGSKFGVWGRKARTLASKNKIKLFFFSNFAGSESLKPAAYFIYHQVKY
jgi:hypothetical protein